MNLRRLFWVLLVSVLGICCSCEDDDSRPPTQWLYFAIVAEEPIHFSKIYVREGPVIYLDTTYVYPEPGGSLSEYNSFKLPLSPFSDAVTYIFEQPDRTDTLQVTYLQGPGFSSKQEGVLYLFSDHQISYTTFDSLIICDLCY